MTLDQILAQLANALALPEEFRTASWREHVGWLRTQERRWTQRYAA